MLHFSASPFELSRGVWRHRGLVSALIRREVVGRYRGSALGLMWSFFNPVFMLSVYTFVFSEVFKARWSGASGDKSEFALILFAGLMVFNLFAECINRAPTLVLANPNYVKKVIFPLEMLPWVNLGAAFFHMAISFLVWLFFYFICRGVPPATIWLLPLVILPLLLFTLGVSWALAALGVYLRDIAQVTALLTTVLMFMSPIFYPASSLPSEYRALLNLNPLVPIIEQARNVMIWGQWPTWNMLAAQYVASFCVAWAGFAWFQKTRKGFADVL